MGELIAPRHPTAGAGVAVTFQGDAPDRGVFWEVVSVDFNTGAEDVARGYLKWQRTRTNGAGQSVNFFFAPTGDSGQDIRYDTGRIYDTPNLVYEGQALMIGNDRIRARAV